TVKNRRVTLNMVKVFPVFLDQLCANLARERTRPLVSARHFLSARAGNSHILIRLNSRPSTCHAFASSVAGGSTGGGGTAAGADATSPNFSNSANCLSVNGGKFSSARPSLGAKTNDSMRVLIISALDAGSIRSIASELNFTYLG